MHIAQNQIVLESVGQLEFCSKPCVGLKWLHSLFSCTFSHLPWPHSMSIPAFSFFPKCVPMCLDLPSQQHTLFYACPDPVHPKFNDCLNHNHKCFHFQLQSRGNHSHIIFISMSYHSIMMSYRQPCLQQKQILTSRYT